MLMAITVIFFLGGGGLAQGPSDYHATPCVAAESAGAVVTLLIVSCKTELSLLTNKWQMHMLNNTD